MLKILLAPISTIGLIAFLTPLNSYAVCPVCTLAVGTGVGICRYLGIDDLITGTWAGALLMSVSLWTINWLNSKNIRFHFRKILVIIFYYAITIIPLFFMDIIGQSGNAFCLIKDYLYIDKFVVGVIAGTIVFSALSLLHLYLKKNHDNKSYFPFQKVILPLVGLIILSFIFNYVK